jgi:hypothetical protein
VDRAVLAELAELRADNHPISTTIILRSDLKPAPPWTWTKFNRFNRLVDDILDRVTDVIGDGEDGITRPHIDSLNVDPTHAAISLIARVAFVDELLKQPEVAECLDGAAYYFLDERTTAVLE